MADNNSVKKQFILNIRKYLLSLLFCAIITKHFSQEPKLSIDVNLPVLLGQNFLADNYFGVFDLGVAYEFAELNTTKIGAAVNASFLRSTNNATNNNFDVRVYAIQPKIFAKFRLNAIKNLHIKTGLGYALFIFNLVPNANTGQFNLNQGRSSNENGINLNTALHYDFAKKFYATVQYDFVKLSTDKSALNNPYNTNLNILKLGVGIRI